MIKRDYVNVGSAGRPQYIHFRRAGTGPALVMLHASPMSSAALLPFIEVAAQFVTVIAPDTPGYGWSDPLVESTGNLEGYVTALNTFVERLGLDGFGLYGSATGAQIAIEYSKAYAGKVSYLILDNAAHFTDEERERIVSGYFPDLTPDQMGSHLIKTWSAARNQGLFFPWHETTSAARLPGGGVNADFAQMIALEYLQAGKDYDLAYRAAFANEKMERMQPITIPTIIIRWEGSILKPYTDRFDSVEWPDNFTMLHCGPTREQRTQAFKSIFTERMCHGEGETCNVKVQAEAGIAPTTGVAMKGFSDVDAGRCHYLSAGDEQLPALLLLHDIGSSHRSLTALIASLSEKYRVFAPDLPGHGLSYRPEEGKRGIGDMADVLVELASSLRWRRILSIKGSAAIAVELAARLAPSVEELKLINPIDYSALKDEWETDKLCPNFNINAEGTHFLQTWYMLCDRQLFWPWYATDPGHALRGEANLDADYLTERFKEFWQAQPLLDELWEQVLNYPLGERLSKLQCSVDVDMIETDPLTGVGRRSLNTQRFLRPGNDRM